MRARAVALLSIGALLWAVTLPSGCSPDCVDADGDGRGEHCKAGPDCDDHDARLGERCDAAAKACVDAPFAAGCPCPVGAHRACFTGDGDVLGIGECRAGEQRCNTGVWTACHDEVLAHFESCNARDDDCDGITDEGVLSPCGGCNPDCQGGVWGPPAAPFAAEGDLAVTELGELTLRLRTIEARTVWVPNTGDGTLSKIDAGRAREVARYRVYGATPERVAVDYNGDAWVLSPSLDGSSQLTRVAADVDRCVDRGGGGVTTSQGPDDLLPLGDDECVVFHAGVGGEAEVARSLAIDGARSEDGTLGGDVWVGMQDSERVVQLDGQSGEVLREVALSGVAPFDATFDPWGTLWVIDRQGLLARVQAGTEPASLQVLEAPLRCYLLDALASDAAGALTLTGSSCEDVITYDPARDRWQHVSTTGLLDARGVVVLGDETWVAHTAGQISRVSRDPLSFLATFGLDARARHPLESIAIGADSLQQLWVVSSMGGDRGAGLATRFDPSAERVTAQVSVGHAPRALGDITGSRRHGEFAREASAQYVFDGCTIEPVADEPQRFEPTEWGALHVVWQPGLDARVRIEARHAETRGALEDADFVALGTLPEDPEPYPLSFPIGGVVEVRLTLLAGSRIGAPRIARVGIEWQCPGPD
jgi:streptogramin lyase